MRFGRTHPVALTLIVIAAVLMMMPLFWVLALSFKANAALMADTNSVFSLPYTLANYRTLFGDGQVFRWIMRSEEHTSELQSLMRISYAVFCLKKKKS